jgi:hypothetical protein
MYTHVSKYNENGEKKKKKERKTSVACCLLSLNVHRKHWSLARATLNPPLALPLMSLHSALMALALIGA